MKPLTLQSAHDKQSETIQKQAHKIAMLVKQVEANGECHKGLTAKPCHCEAIESAHDKLKQLCDDLFENPYYVEYEFNGGAKTQSIDFWIAGEVIELWDTGDISMFRTPSEPQLLEIQKAQRLLLVGEE
jgi:phosphoribosylformylglycinamidine (FGAM) synthase PurS component